MLFSKNKIKLSVLAVVAIFTITFESNVFALIDNWYHYEHGIELLDDNNYYYAKKEFNYYLEHPEIHRHMFGIAWFGRGLIYLKLRDDNGAIFAFKMAIANDLHPTFKISDKSYMNMGQIFFRRKAYDEAVKLYLKAVESNPNSGLAHYYLGLAYFETGEYDKAAKEAEDAKKLRISFTALSEKLSKINKEAGSNK